MTRAVPAETRAPATRAALVAAALVAAAVVAAAVLAACGPAASVTPGPVETASLIAPATATPAAAPPASPVDGLLIHLDATGLTEVTGFTLRTDDGTEIVFRMGVLENGAQFPPGHLAEHMATSSPVRVFFRPEAGDLVVYRIEDAPAP